GHPVTLGKAAETAALDQAGDTDRRATAALDIAAAVGDHRVVGAHPDVARLDRYRRLRRMLAGASVAHEGIVQRDAVHRPRPDQQRAGRARRSLIAVAAALDDDAQPIRARKIDGVHDILRATRRDDISAWRRRPAIDPSTGLRQRRAVADVIRILELFENLRAGWPIGRGCAGRKWRHDRSQTATDGLIELFPTGRRRPRRIP